jgi:hypothetical protein
MRKTPRISFTWLDSLRLGLFTPTPEDLRRLGLTQQQIDEAVAAPSPRRRSNLKKARQGNPARIGFANVQTGRHPKTFVPFSCKSASTLFSGRAIHFSRI